MSKPKFNPFRPGHVITPGMFTGRIEEIEAMARGLFQTKNGNPQHFLIEGERGIGKTSLMLFLDWLARGDVTFDSQKFNFLVVSVELREGMNSDDLINTLLAGLRHEMASREPLKKLCGIAWEFLTKFEVLGCSFDNSQPETSSTKLDDLTNTLLNLLTAGKSEIDGVLILVDEADKAASDTKLGEICKLLTERLTRKGCERLSILLAGLPGLLAQIRDGHESAPRVFEILSLEPLEMDERKRVIIRGLEEADKTNGFPTTITEQALVTLAGLSEGYPHFLQQFSFCAFEKDSDNEINSEDVAAGAFSENGAIDQLGRKYYTGLYIDQIGSEEYRKVLVCMAESLDGWVERQHLIDKSGVKGSTVDNALRALKERRIIVANPAKSGQYKLPTKSFAIWIKVKETGTDGVTLPTS